MKSAFVLLLGLIGCATDEPMLDPATCDGSRVFQLDAVELPNHTVGVRELAVDLDDNGIRDNWLGAVASSIQSMPFDHPLDLSATATAHLNTDTDWRISIAECPDDQRLISLSAGDEPLVSDVVGRVFEGTLRATGQVGRVPITTLFDGTGMVVPSFLDTARLEIEMAEPTDELSARLVLAVRDIEAPVVHALTPFLDANLGEDLSRDSFDLDGDGTLSEAEIAAHPFTRSLLTPDLQLSGPAYSLGLQVHGTARR